jgi:hypothetical protein
LREKREIERKESERGEGGRETKTTRERQRQSQQKITVQKGRQSVRSIDLQLEAFTDNPNSFTNVWFDNELLLASSHLFLEMAILDCKAGKYGFDFSRLMSMSVLSD